MLSWHGMRALPASSSDGSLSRFSICRVDMIRGEKEIERKRVRYFSPREMSALPVQDLSRVPKGSRSRQQVLNLLSFESIKATTGRSQLSASAFCNSRTSYSICQGCGDYGAFRNREYGPALALVNRMHVIISCTVAYSQVCFS